MSSTSYPSRAIHFLGWWMMVEDRFQPLELSITGNDVTSRCRNQRNSMQILGTFLSVLSVQHYYTFLFGWYSSSTIANIQRSGFFTTRHKICQNRGAKNHILSENASIVLFYEYCVFLRLKVRFDGESQEEEKKSKKKLEEKSRERVFVRAPSLSTLLIEYVALY
jgi:hypothetical protein